MDQWPQVESCLECSAKTLQFVQDVFFYAVKVGPPTDLLLNLLAQHGMHPAALSCTLKPLLVNTSLRHPNPDLLCSPLQAVLHPQAPLMDIAQGRLQPLCIKALKRVFIMSDKNQVSHLVDLYAFSCPALPVALHEQQGATACFPEAAASQLA